MYTILIHVSHTILIHVSWLCYCHNPNPNNRTQTQHNLNTVLGLDMKMTVQTPPTTHHPTPPQKLKGGRQETRANIY